MADREPYTAFGSDKKRTPMDLVVGGATLPFNPSTYAFGYTHFPGWWSGSKGLWVPTAAGKDWAAAGSKIRTAFAGDGGGLLKGTGQILGSAWKLGPLGGGHRIFGGLNSNVNNYNSLYKKYTNRANKYNSMSLSAQRKLDYTRELLTDAQMRFDKTNYAPMGKTNKASVKLEQRALRNKRLLPIQDELTALTDIKLKYENKVSRYTSRDKRYSALATKAAHARSVYAGGKTLLRLGKAASLIGALALTWDLTKMVAEPLGRTAVASFGAAMDKYNDRFSPEVGGKLAMSYLTQGAATERQRALQAMSRSGISGRSAFGQEARFQN